MPKMVRTARGDLVDWDLMRIQTQQNNNVAEKVEIAPTAPSLASRREQRAKMEAAKKLLEQARQEEARIKQIATLPPVAEESDPDWDHSPVVDDGENEQTTKSKTKKQ